MIFDPEATALHCESLSQELNEGTHVGVLFEIGESLRFILSRLPDLEKKLDSLREPVGGSDYA